ncbi:hypothetical protein [Mycolicibacterium celeriflavum]|uniref:Uncharacterized protein n=1 Tax=Mycolicibacterium celeriflavum TaxID=1249101 RepID=A0A1X0BT14_MYCCF|nr:hypothetical protein [Mycolicibacterium celeriflavum]MCV7239211.1 hypothetical protein [Mycolicibacterium celeriflavum]ORA46924.1 hypothetical protein BST21_13845 [Mycolicibacterium celeriflavum]BBY44513.1 hypothetical protein MCEL_28080 [Mycolicibacterium celeriflavum]
MKILIAIAVASAAAIALAPNASAATPPVAEGMHKLCVASGECLTEQVSYNCGPDCFSMDDIADPKSGTHYRFDPATSQWRAPSNGNWTPDGVTFHTPSGTTATLSPL